MKKIIISLAFLFLAAVAFAQSGKQEKTDRIYKDNWCTINWNGSSFVFNSLDTETNHILSFTLGSNKSMAIAKLEKMLEWYEEAEVKESVTFKEGATDITFYKADVFKMIISDGGVDFCKTEYSKRLEGFTFVLGEAELDKRESAHHYSLLQKKALTKPITTIAALKDPKYGD